MVLEVVLGGTGLLVGYPKDGSDHVLSGKTNGWLNFGEFRFLGWPWRVKVGSFFVSLHLIPLFVSLKDEPQQEGV